MTHSIAINSTITKDTESMQAKAGSSKNEMVKNEKHSLALTDMETMYCGRYIDDEVLPDDNDNCSLCGSKIGNFGECLYSENSCSFEEHKGITIYKCTPRNYFYTSPIWADYLFWDETLEGLKIKIDNLK